MQQTDTVHNSAIDTVVIAGKGLSALENACQYTSIHKRGSKWFLQADCFTEGTDHRERYIYQMDGQNLVVTFPLSKKHATATFFRCR